LKTHNEASILAVLDYHYNKHKYILHNSFIYGYWECDWFGITHQGYQYEIEVKISRQDFKADMKKREKHERFMRAGKEFATFPGRGFMKWNNDIKDDVELCGVVICKNITPHKFFYAVPRGLIQIKEVPDYAGLLWINQNNTVTKKKEAPFLHKREQDLRGVLLEKFYFKHLYRDAKRDKFIEEMNRIKSEIYLE